MKSSPEASRTTSVQGAGLFADHEVYLLHFVLPSRICKRGFVVDREPVLGPGWLLESVYKALVRRWEVNAHKDPP